MAMPPGDVETAALSSTTIPSVPEATADAVTRGGAAASMSAATGTVGGRAATSAPAISASSDTGAGSAATGTGSAATGVGSAAAGVGSGTTGAGAATLDAVRVTSGSAAATEGVKKPVERLAEAGVGGAGFASWRRPGMSRKKGKGAWRGFLLESNWVVDIVFSKLAAMLVPASVHESARSTGHDNPAVLTE